MGFSDRQDAGRRLAVALEPYVRPDSVLLAVPRGGVPVAAEVAHRLGAPLDVVVVRKLGVPSRPELAMGAIGEDGVRLLDGEVIRRMGVGEDQIASVERAERRELERRTIRYRQGRERIGLLGADAVLIDDGAATGSSALAAAQVVRALGAASVTVAVPVASPTAHAELRRQVERVVCLEVPTGFRAVGGYYGDFDATSDEQVVELLDRFGPRTEASGRRGDSGRDQR